MAFLILAVAILMVMNPGIVHLKFQVIKAKDPKILSFNIFVSALIFTFPLQSWLNLRLFWFLTSGSHLKHLRKI